MKTIKLYSTGLFSKQGKLGPGLYCISDSCNSESGPGMETEDL